MNPKVLSERIGHASVSFTMQTYVQRSSGRDRDAADAVAKLILETKATNAGDATQSIVEEGMP